MNTLERIKQAQLESRKARLNVRATLLTTFIGEATMIGKNAGDRETTEEEVITLLRKFEKNLMEFLDNIRNSTGEDAKIASIEHELAIIREFLPVKLTDLQIGKDIGTLMTQMELPREMKSLSVINKALKEKYGTQFDSKQVSTVFKDMLR